LPFKGLNALRKRDIGHFSGNPEGLFEAAQNPLGSTLK
jgi:hypothetical protein